MKGARYLFFATQNPQHPMDDNKRAYVSMCEKVDAYLLLKVTDIAATPAVAANTLQGTLHDKIDETLANDTKANLDNTGQTIAKNDERAELNESTRRVIPYLYKYFLALPDRRMAERINFNKSALDKMDDNFFYENAKMVYDTANDATVKAAIIVLGYTNALHTAHNTNLGEFRNLIGTPRMLSGDTSSYNRAVERNMVELHELIDKIDIEMNLLEFDFTTLFDGYYACRKIDDAGSSGGSVSSGTVSSGESKLVRSIVYDAGINLKLENSGAIDLLFVLMESGAQVGLKLMVPAGDTQNHPITDLHTSGDSLMVLNSGLSTGAYKVTFS